MKTRQITMDSRGHAAVGECYRLYLSIRANNEVLQVQESMSVLVKGPNAPTRTHARFDNGIAHVDINLEDEGRYTIHVGEGDEEVGSVDAIGTSQVASLTIERKGGDVRVGENVVYNVKALKADGSLDDCFDGFIRLGIDGAASYNPEQHLCDGEAAVSVTYREAGCHQVAAWLAARSQVRTVHSETVTHGVPTQLRIFTKSSVIAGERFPLLVQVCDDAQNATEPPSSGWHDPKVTFSSPDPCIESQTKPLDACGYVVFHATAPHQLGPVDIVVSPQSIYTPIRSGHFTLEVVARRYLDLAVPQHIEAGVPFWCCVRALDRYGRSGPYDGVVSISVGGQEIQRTVPTGDGRVELSLPTSDRQMIEVRDNLGSVPVEKWVVPGVAVAAPALRAAGHVSPAIVLGP